MCNRLRCPGSRSDVSWIVPKRLELKLYAGCKLIGGGVVKVKPSKGSRCDNER